MDLVSYLSIIRRRWALLVATVAVALVVVWITLPATPRVGQVVHSYKATATLISNPTVETPINLTTAAMFVTVGDVPRRAAKTLDFHGRPQVLAAKVAAAADVDSGTITITGRDASGKQIARTVNVFATELIAQLRRMAAQERDRQFDELNKLLRSASRELERLDAAIQAEPSNTSLLAQRDAVSESYSAVFGQLTALNQAAVTGPSLTVLQPASPVPEVTGGFAPPSSLGDRLLAGGVLGLLLGVALALVVERVDSRLRTREQAEDAFQLPVLAEIPGLPWNRRQSTQMLSATDPGSATAEAYRTLRSAVLLLRNDLDVRRGAGPTVILVTSPRNRDGKTTTVANLAVVLAEAGRRVLVLSFDFRNPRIQDYLDVPEGTGLSDLLSAQRPHDLRQIVRDTQFPGVQVATSGQELGHPGAMLTGAGPLIAKARELADVVLIDTAPMLAVSDAVDLSAHVDVALVVGRLNRTTAQQAAAVQRLSSRLGLPTLGAVLVGAPPGSPLGRYAARHLTTERAS